MEVEPTPEGTEEYGWRRPDCFCALFLFLLFCFFWWIWEKEML